MDITFELKPIARWESKGGKYWASLFSDGVAVWYSSDSGGGSFGKVSEADGLIAMQAKVDSGYFLPDAAKTPMKKVEVK